MEDRFESLDLPAPERLLNFDKPAVRDWDTSKTASIGANMKGIFRPEDQANDNDEALKAAGCSGIRIRAIPVVAEVSNDVFCLSLWLVVHLPRASRPTYPSPLAGP